MLKAKQISFLDHVELLGTADHIALVSPKEVAQKFECCLERSYDNLGEFEFVGIEFNKILFGFRRFTDDVNEDFSYVSVRGALEKDTISKISELLDLPIEKIQKFPDKF